MKSYLLYIKFNITENVLQSKTYQLKFKYANEGKMYGVCCKSVLWIGLDFLI